MHALGLHEISAAVQSGDTTILQKALPVLGTTCTGSISHAFFFGKQVRNGNTTEQATIRLPTGFRAHLSANATRKRIMAAAITLGHGISKSGYNALYNSDCGLPAGYDTTTSDFKDFLNETVRVCGGGEGGVRLLSHAFARYRCSILSLVC